MIQKGQMLQDPFLNALRKEHVAVSIYLVMASNCKVKLIHLINMSFCLKTR